MMPILYSPDERVFDSNGLGILSDAVSCEVTWEKNGQYELVLVYPTHGIHADLIADRSVILAKPAPDKQAQPFRIYRPVPASTGQATYYARHIAYDLQGIPAAPFSASGVSNALSRLRASAVVDCPFSFSADFDATGTLAPGVPKAIWELMGTGENGILNTYGGEWEFDRFSAILHERLGADTGYSIRYGKNLRTLEMDKNIADCYTGIYPYYADSDGNLTQLPGKIVNADGEFDHTRIKVVDLSSEFDEAPGITELNLAAQEHILSNNIGVPPISWKIEFVDLAQTEEYKDHPGLGTVSWGDSVNVVFPDLQVDATARVVAAKYNVLLDRFINITLGSVQASIADTIVANKRSQQLEAVRKQREYLARMKRLAEEAAARAEQARKDAEAKAKEMAEAAQEAAEEFAKEYTDEAEKDANDYTDDKTQEAKDYADDSVEAMDELLNQTEIFNRLTKNGTAQGMFLDENGDVYLNATYMKSGILLADLIRAGILQSLNGKTFYLDLEQGVLKMEATELSIAGQTVEEIVTGKVDEAIVDYTEAVTKDIESLQSQIDGNITTWFLDGEPTARNLPASGWTTEEDKNAHLGDLYYDNKTGYCYRWQLSSSTYSWTRVKDTDVTKALADAAAAQDTADSKRRVFISTPAPPYDVGDLWAQGSSGDIMMCKTARSSGYYRSSDWVLASNYIDEDTAGSIAQDKVDAQTQADIFNKLTNNGQTQGIYLQNGRVYINASYMATGILASKDGSTFYLDLDKGVLKMKATELSISGKTVEEIAADEAEAAGDAALEEAKAYVDAQTQTDIFNKLTNNGQTQGLYLKDGKIYLNMEYLVSQYLDATNVSLRGKFAVYNGSTLGGYLGYMAGATSTGSSNGIAMSDSGGTHYVIATNSGARMQAGSKAIVVTDKHAMITGDLYVSGNVYEKTTPL